MDKIIFTTIGEGTIQKNIYIFIDIYCNIIMGADIAIDIHCDITMGGEIAIGIHCELLMLPWYTHHDVTMSYGISIQKGYG